VQCRVLASLALDGDAWTWGLGIVDYNCSGGAWQLPIGFQGLVGWLVIALVEWNGMG